jgi:putative DNA primase/helicase
MIIPQHPEQGGPAILGHYRNEGIKLVRLNGKNRKPIDPNWPQVDFPLEEFKKHVRRGGGVGLQCGEVSGWLSVVDADWPEARKLAPTFLPETLRAAKGDEGPSHFFVRSVGLGHKQFRGRDNSVIIDLKASSNGAGHQVVVEPSIHPTKGPYCFVGGYDPAAIAGVDKDEALKRVGMLASAALIARELPPAREEGGGGRHDLALALCGYMLRNGESAGDVEEILAGAWEVRGASREAVEDVRRSVRDTEGRLARDEPATGGRRLEELMAGLPQKIADFLGWERPDHREQRRHYEPSDVGNAGRFVDRCRDRVRWCPAAKKWLYWDGERWSWDERGEVVKLAHETARSIYKDAANETDPDRQKQIAKFALATQNESRINAMMSQAKPYLFVGMDDLDTDGWLLNCRNGTLDLRTGRLRDHDPADLITRMVPTAYDPGAEAPRFERFLKEALVDDAVITFVRRFSGYTATGSTRERLVAILHGNGRNGKSTLVELLQDVLGDYAKGTAVETLLMKKNETIGNEVAALKGARFVAAAEVEKGRRLAESKVKQLTGRDTVTARFLFAEPFDFRPEFKLWLSTNNKPVIQGTDDAIWDRLRLIPFNRRFEGAAADPKLDERLRAEMPGVLAWVVAGCLEWQEHGLQEPEEVTDATRQYREEMDTLAAFIEERCIVHEDASAPATPLYKQYRMWCEDAGERPETQKMFGMRLRERGFAHERISGGEHKGRKGWFGIGIRVNHGGPDPDEERSSPAPNSAESETEGSLGEPREHHGSPHENEGFAGNSSGAEEAVNHSEPLNCKVPKQNPRVWEEPGKWFTMVHSVHSDEKKGGPSDYEKLSEDVIAAEMRRSNSGPAKALATLLEKPTDERLKWLTCAVLTAKGMDAGDCERHAGAVKAAATDPANHPPGCGCGGCS